MRPVRNQAVQQGVSKGQGSEASSVFPSLPMARAHITTRPPPPAPSEEKLSSTKPVPGAKKLGDRCHRGPQPLLPGGLEVCEGVCASHDDRGTSGRSQLSLRRGAGLQICLLKIPKASL